MFWLCDRLHSHLPIPIYVLNTQDMIHRPANIFLTLFLIQIKMFAWKQKRNDPERNMILHGFKGYMKQMDCKERESHAPETHLLPFYGSPHVIHFQVTCEWLLGKSLHLNTREQKSNAYIHNKASFIH